MGLFRIVNGRRVALVASAMAMVACASKTDEPTNPQYSSKTEPLSFESSQTDEIDLIRLIDPENRRAQLPGDSCPVTDEALGHRNKDIRREASLQNLECALQAFKTYSISYGEFLRSVRAGGDQMYERAATSVALAVRRNEIQDRLILRSETLCRDFQRRLDIELKIDNDTNLSNFVRNSQQRLIGGVGSLVLGGDMLWALTNASKITDLPGYVHDLGQIEKTTLRIADEGMKLNRQAIFAKIDAKRRAPVRHGGLAMGAESAGTGVTPITAYSLERAIADGLAYHNSCSVYAGLTYAMRLISGGAPDRSIVEFPSLVSTGVNP